MATKHRVVCRFSQRKNGDMTFQYTNEKREHVVWFFCRELKMVTIHRTARRNIGPYAGQCYSTTADRFKQLAKKRAKEIGRTLAI
jgi:hypothetical protein